MSNYCWQRRQHGRPAMHLLRRRTGTARHKGGFVTDTTRWFWLSARVWASLDSMPGLCSTSSSAPSSSSSDNAAGHPIDDALRRRAEAGGGTGRAAAAAAAAHHHEPLSSPESGEVPEAAADLPESVPAWARSKAGTCPLDTRTGLHGGGTGGGAGGGAAAFPDDLDAALMSNTDASADAAAPAVASVAQLPLGVTLVLAAEERNAEVQRLLRAPRFALVGRVCTAHQLLLLTSLAGACNG